MQYWTSKTKETKYLKIGNLTKNRIIKSSCLNKMKILMTCKFYYMATFKIPILTAIFK